MENIDLINEQKNLINNVRLRGKIVNDFIISHKTFKEVFYKATLEVSRLSGDVDYINIVISERDLKKKKYVIGDLVEVIGEIRSYNYYDEKLDKRKLIISVFVKEIKEIDSSVLENKADTNKVHLTGFVCKKPIYRTTPFGREITDLLIAVNRLYGKSDYLPCVTWGRNARYAENFNIGDTVELTGRMQSRRYNKVNSDGVEEEKVAYEVSVVTISDKEEKEAEISEQ